MKCIGSAYHYKFEPCFDAADFMRAGKVKEVRYCSLPNCGTISNEHIKSSKTWLPNATLKSIKRITSEMYWLS